MGGQTPELREEAGEFWTFLVHLVFDTLKNLALLAALSAIFFSPDGSKTLACTKRILSTSRIFILVHLCGAPLDWVRFCR
jgi:hypothetical protein